MGVTSRRGRLIVAAVATVSVLGVGACSGTNAKNDSGTAAAGKVKLIVDTCKQDRHGPIRAVCNTHATL